MYVDPADVALYLNNIAGKYGKYGGYSMSNPMAAPPIQGTYQKSPPEGSFWIMMIVPEHLRDAAIKDFQQMVSKFQQDYNQKEILFLVSSLTRYSP